jgi:hypothetical protein
LLCAVAFFLPVFKGQRNLRRSRLPSVHLLADFISSPGIAERAAVRSKCLVILLIFWVDGNTRISLQPLDDKGIKFSDIVGLVAKEQKTFLSLYLRLSSLRSLKAIAWSVMLLGRVISTSAMPSFEIFDELRDRFYLLKML